MSHDFTEGHLAFSFADNWEVQKYDTHNDYLKRICKLQGTKAVDFVGMARRALFMIEVKDFRGHRIENKERLNGPLAEEVAIKVRDTIAGLVGAHRTSSQPATWSSFVTCISAPTRCLHVVLWFEDDAAHTPELARARALTITDLLKQQLRWLTTKILVVSLQTYANSLPELAVRNLAGAAGRRAHGSR